MIAKLRQMIADARRPEQIEILTRALNKELAKQKSDIPCEKRDKEMSKRNPNPMADDGLGDSLNDCMMEAVAKSNRPTAVLLVKTLDDAARTTREMNRTGLESDTEVARDEEQHTMRKTVATATQPDPEGLRKAQDALRRLPAYLLGADDPLWTGRERLDETDLLALEDHGNLVGDFALAKAARQVRLSRSPAAASPSSSPSASASAASPSVSASVSRNVRRRKDGKKGTTTSASTEKTVVVKFANGSMEILPRAAVEFE